MLTFVFRVLCASIGTGWEFPSTTFLPAGKISRMNLSTNAVPRRMSVARREAMLNQTRVQSSPRRRCRSINP